VLPDEHQYKFVSYLNYDSILALSTVNKMFLGFLTSNGLMNALKSNFGAFLGIGDVLDAQDIEGHWYAARVQDAKDGKLLVHYEGWPSKWDEWLDRTSPKLLPIKTKSLKETPPPQFAPVFLLVGTDRLPLEGNLRGEAVALMERDLQNWGHALRTQPGPLTQLIVRGRPGLHRSSRVEVDCAIVHTDLNKLKKKEKKRKLTDR
jgi:hypothetical protein